MALRDHVNWTIRRVGTSLKRANFGIGLVLAMHRAWEARTRSYDEEGISDDFESTSVVRRMADAYFAQSPSPATALIGRRDTADDVGVRVVSLRNSTSYDVTIGGLLHRVTSSASETAANLIGKMVTQIAGGYEVTAVVAGAAGYFQVAGNHLDEFLVGQTFTIYGSTGNDGTYTVVSAALSAGNTRITVAMVPDATVDGHIGGYAIIVADATNNHFTVTGDVRTRFPAGLEVGVKGSTGNDNAAGSPYVVVSTALDGNGDTEIYVVNVASAVADGAIVSFADGATAQNEVSADVATWAVATSVLGTDTITVTADLTGVLAVGEYFWITDSAGNTGRYRVASIAFVTPTTTIVTAEDLPATETSPNAGNLSIERAVVSPDSASQFYTIVTESKLRLEFAAGQAADEDFDDCVDSNNTFYGVYLDGRDVDDVMALANHVEALGDANPKLFQTGTSDSTAHDTADASDDPLVGSVGKRIRSLGLARTWCFWHSTAGEDGDESASDTYPEIRLCAKMLTTDPGSSTWHDQTLVGLTVDEFTADARANLVAKGYTFYEDVSGLSATVGGTVGESGIAWIDTIVGSDWLRMRLMEECYTAVHSAANAGTKVPHTVKGYGTFESAIRSVAQEGVDNGYIESIGTITVPTERAPAADRQARVLNLPSAFSFGLAGAVGTIDGSGEVYQ